ncbi:MAG TPA: hypothetical protein PKE07_06655 [Lacibacter sp.]|nr:hypothetical protein [Lacibacter sp.]HMO90209.1 hypothetical protein [Lacibacter sp.]
MKQFLLFCLTCLLLTPALAQQPLSGTVYDSTRRNLVEGVQVLCTCGTMGFTDSTGAYTLYVGDEDSVFFVFRGKPTQLFAVSRIKDMNNFEIALPLHVPGRYKQLKEIIVYGRNRRQDSIENRLQYDKVFNYSRGGLRFSNSAPESGFGAGLDLEALINVFRFRQNRSMARFQQRLIREEQDRYIDSRFNRTIVKRLTPLTDGPQLDAFLQQYRPEYELLTQALDIELYMYIQAAAKEFLKGR